MSIRKRCAGYLLGVLGVFSCEVLWSDQSGIGGRVSSPPEAGLHSHLYPCWSSLHAAPREQRALQRRNHPRPSELVYVVEHFEFEPFVAVRGGAAVRIEIRVEGPEVTHLSLDTRQFPFFEEEVLFLEDDGFAPDEVEGDGLYTGLLTPRQTVPDGGADRLWHHTIRALHLRVHNQFGIPRDLIEDVGYGYGFIAEPGDIPAAAVSPGIQRTDRVVNYVNPDWLVGSYPMIDLDKTTVSRVFLDEFGDRFDWLIFVHVYNNRSRPLGAFTPVKNAVKGIGLDEFDHTMEYGSDGVLRALVDVFFKDADALTHNLFHTWGVYGLPQLSGSDPFNGEGHWGALMTTGESTVFGIPATYESFTLRDDGLYCSRFSENGSALALEHYLMGHLPLDEVNEYRYLESSSFRGIGCGGYLLEGAGVRGLNAEVLLSELGEREPSYPDVSRFHAGVVAVSDRLLTPVEMEFLERTMAEHERGFSERFGRKASISYLLDPVAQAEITDVVVNGEGIAVSITGPPGQLIIEESNDLKDWGEHTVWAPTGEYVYRVASENLGALGFFRVRSGN